jgi:hypothetical protein
MSGRQELTNHDFRLGLGEQLALNLHISGPGRRGADATYTHVVDPAIQVLKRRVPYCSARVSHVSAGAIFKVEGRPSGQVKWMLVCQDLHALGALKAAFAPGSDQAFGSASTLLYDVPVQRVPVLEPQRLVPSGGLDIRHIEVSDVMSGDGVGRGSMQRTTGSTGRSNARKRSQREQLGPCTVYSGLGAMGT